MLLMITCLDTLNALPTRLRNTETQNKDLSDEFMIEQYDAGSNHFLTNRQYENDQINEDYVVPEKRQLEKKWTKFYQGSQSPYTIAFPSLIRTRRYIKHQY